MWLGGDNFDQALVDHTLKYIKKEYGLDPTGNMRFMVALRRAAQTTKERLTAAKSADLIVEGLKDEDGDSIDVVLEITQSEFEDMIRPLVQRTVALTEEALRKSGLTPDQIDGVLMAGNATAMPLVQQAMEKMFGKNKVLRNVHPKHSVALGAAIVAARIGERIVCQAIDPSDPKGKRECGTVNKEGDTHCKECGAPLAAEAAEVEGDALAGNIIIGGIAPFHYGIQTTGDKFNVFINKGDPYPTENPQAQLFYTRVPNQRMISIPVYGGTHLDKASANEKQGHVFAILPPGLPQDTPIRIKIWLNSDQIFDLSANLEDGTDLRPLATPGRGRSEGRRCHRQGRGGCRAKKRGDFARRATGARRGAPAGV